MTSYCNISARYVLRQAFCVLTDKSPSCRLPPAWFRCILHLEFYTSHFTSYSPRSTCYTFVLRITFCTHPHHASATPRACFICPPPCFLLGSVLSSHLHVVGGSSVEWIRTCLCWQPLQAASVPVRSG